MKERNFQLIIVGVGGQGILTVSDILGTAAISENLKPIMSEVHGMAQRGGVVVTEMKLGNFASPLIGDGQADAVLSFEPLEAYRALRKAHQGSYIITNSEPLVPPNVSIGKALYPDINEMFENIKKAGLKFVSVPALELAQQAGSTKVGNVVMLGALCAVPDFVLSRESIEKAIKSRVSEKMAEVNLTAFNLGFSETQKQL